MRTKKRRHIALPRGRTRHRHRAEACPRSKHLTAESKYAAKARHDEYNRNTTPEASRKQEGQQEANRQYKRPHDECGPASGDGFELSSVNRHERSLWIDGTSNHR